MIVWWLWSKVRVKLGHERAELRCELWLSEKAPLVWARPMEVMLMAGHRTE